MMKSQLTGFLLVCLVAGSSLSAQSPQAPSSDGAQATSGSQATSPERRRGPGGEGMRELFQNAISGSVQSVTADGLTIKKIDGTTVTVKTTKDTMFRHERQVEGKLSDFKVGDQVIVAGDPAGDNAVTAKFVALRPNGPNAMNPEDLGKKFIVGEVTQIAETKLTIKRPDGVEQVIEVDDDTSFKNSKRESVTLAELKVGDHVMGRGELKNGTFIPATLMVGMPQGGQGFGMRRREGASGPRVAEPSGGAPPSGAPSTPPQDSSAPKQDL
jgi:Domain of unknown function (DUF5666)